MVIKIYIGKESKVVVQGITGNQGTFHTHLMLDYGTNIIAGVTPKKGGQTVHGIPVYDNMKKAILEHDANTSIVFVPAKFAYEAIAESINSGISLTCIITEGIPIFDMVRLVEKAKEKETHLIGPNCPGILIPDKIKLGIMPSDMSHFGNVAIISKSGTLSYEITKAIGNVDIGVSAFIGIGGDPVRGTTMIEAVKYYSKDPSTKIIILIGEIGSDEEEKTAEFIKNYVTKPVIAYIAGKSAPERKRMGHAGAIISSNFGTAQGKISALKNAGALIAETPWDIPQMIKSIL